MDLNKKTIENTDKSVEKYLIGREDTAIVIDHLEYFTERVDENGWILDMGCGHGRDCWYYNENGFHTVGIDLSSNMLEVAQKRCHNCFFLNMDMRDIDRVPWRFDGVWASASFYHIPKAESHDVLHKIEGVLNPGGLLYLGVKQGEGEGMIHRTSIGVSKFYAFYKKDEITDLVKNAGFDVIDVNVRGWLDNSMDGDVWINVFATSSG